MNRPDSSITAETGPDAPGPELHAALGRVDADLLRTFVAIVETGSFSRAAERVARTPSAVSMQVKKLEQMLSATLLERDSRAVTLTPQGEVLLPYARRILALTGELMARFRSAEMSGTVRLGAPDDLGALVLPDVLSQFACTHPNVAVDVVIGSSEELSRRHAAGLLDVALVYAQPGAPLTRGSEILLETPLIWTGCRGGAAWQRSPLPLAMWDQTCAWRLGAVEALEQAGRTFRFAYVSANFSVQMSAVSADLAIAPVPAFLIAPPLEGLDGTCGLPPLPSVQIRNLERPGADCRVQAVATLLRRSFDPWQRARPSRHGLNDAACA
ncbi:LysR family transcriptional regulator (plasmid) [Paroceanicella profunda]|uniref:LysR family transcriptional regulator n=1 Tax=Paroceanicella profunda TaxID=2579971 RepID=A0A5B8G1U6_9RHOB|nr:LysR family transcriptional regulator [Paroceanicella profunda]QDL94645.1 LysR family transcriptional regulator [Paroceanicella profunda]